MQRLFAFFIMASVKIASHLFFDSRFAWSPPRPQIRFDRVRLLVFLNHTSLYEPIFITGLPFSALWRIAGHASLPGADVTLDRPLVGTFWKLMMPRISAITRKRDESWEYYLGSIEPDDIVLIAPEGRMMRPDGLDKAGQKMTVRGGIADIIERLDDGYMLLCLSGGLHHVQAPGQFFPRLFKTIHMNVTQIGIREYKARFTGGSRERKIQIVADLQRRLETECPRGV